jgi:predicted glycoside hydrolase/deacetylase ChbG (UPF0249 family)
MNRAITALVLAVASISLSAACARSACAQTSPAVVKPLAERLGYPPGAKLLIVHADDLAVSHSEDAASEEAFATGLVSSASIMVPCPWLTEVAAYARAHPDADLGLHLTLTSEWAAYRWGGVLSKERVPSLYDPSGYLYPTETEAASHIDPREAEAEVRAQIARARALGIRPTHLDSHMGTLFQTRPLFEMLLRVGREERLPVLVSRESFAQSPYLADDLGRDGIALDHVVTIDPSVRPEDWPAFYERVVNGLQPGVTELIVHLAHDDAEMRAVTEGHPDWGAAWRERDFDYLTSARFRKLLDENGVRLITWREIGKLLAAH